MIDIPYFKPVTQPFDAIGTMISFQFIAALFPDEVIIDGLVKIRSKPSHVIPVPHQARDRLQPESSVTELVPGYRLDDVWTPVFTGVTTFYESIIVELGDYSN